MKAQAEPTRNRGWIFSVLVLLFGLTTVFFLYVPKPSGDQLRTGLQQFAKFEPQKSVAKIQQTKPGVVDVAVVEPKSSEEHPMEHAEDEHPHPITAEHNKLFKENFRMGQVLGAIDVADAAGLRTLSAAYKEEGGVESGPIYMAIDVIADCIEHLDEQSIYNAQVFYDTERSSRLRRYVRRFCLK